MKVLFEGGILYKDSRGDEGCREFLIYADENPGFEIRGWGSAYGTPEDRVIDVILKPENWKVHHRSLSHGYPYPWSSNYKEEKNITPTPNYKRSNFPS